MISIYDAGTVDFNNNGITSLNPSLCEVEEQRNGLYELVLEHPFDNRNKWKNLVEGNIIKAPTPMGNQFFRIYKKNKNMSGIKVNARHIFYDLIDNFIEDSRAANTDGKGVLNIVLTSTQYPHRFTSLSDLPGSKTAHFIEKNPVEAIFSEDGIIDTWGGELERDNFLIKLLQNRGKDRGVTIRYGKNLLGIDEDLSLDSVVTRIKPQGYGGLSLPEKYVDSDLINNYPHPKIRNIEYSDIKVDEKSGITEAMAIAKLRERAQQEFTINKIDIPPANYKVDFLELSKTEEYKNYAVLERVYLCDTVTVKHLKYGFDLKAKVIKYKYDCLSNRYKEIELGSFKDNISNTLNSIRNTVNQILQDAVTGTKMQEAIDHATKLLTGALGGNVVFRPKDKPQEILIMDTEDIMTAKSVWRWNLNGLGHSKSGINGPYETAITMGNSTNGYEGHIVGKFISAHSIMANQLHADVGENLVLSSNESVQTMVSTSINNIQISVKNIVKNSKINESSSLYGFGSRDLTVDLIAGKQYTLTVNGRVNAQALTDGKVLKAYLYESTWAYDEPNISIDSTVDVTKSVTFTCTWTGPYRISFYLYPSGGSRLGTATVNWCTLVEGSKALVGWIPAPEDTEQGIKDAKDSANAAQGTADTAKQNAAAANTALDNMSSDNKVTPIEKISIKKEFDIIASEKVKIDSSATTYGVDKTSYGTAYTDLYNYVNPLLINMTTTQDLTKEGTDATGGVTFRKKFKTYYDTRQDILNAISAKAKTLADNAQSLADTAQSLAQAMSLGKMMYTDPTFKNGNNGINVYNNSNNGTVIHTRITKPSDCPTTSTHCLEIKHTGFASPGYGGFQQSIQSRANAKFVVRIIAKIPVGYKLNTASNSMGTGYTDKFITSTEGTGKYEEYVRVVSCGTTGTFSSGGHLYLSGNPAPTSSAPVTWYVAYCTVFDITDTDSISEHERRILSAEQIITPDGIVSKFTESLNNGKVVKTGILTQSKDGLKVESSDSNVSSRITNDGLEVWNGSNRVAWFGDSSSARISNLSADSVIAPNVLNKFGNGVLKDYNIYVKVGGTGDGSSVTNACNSIMLAIKNLTGGAKYLDNVSITVNIMNGTYNENILIEGYVGLATINFACELGVVINGAHKINCNTIMVNFWSASRSTNTGVLFKNAPGNSNLFDIRAANCNFQNTRFSGQGFTGENGILASKNANVLMINIDAANIYHFIWCTDNSRVTLESCRGTVVYWAVARYGGVIYAAVCHPMGSPSAQTGEIIVESGGGLDSEFSPPPVRWAATTRTFGPESMWSSTGSYNQGVPKQGYWSSGPWHGYFAFGRQIRDWLDSNGGYRNVSNITLTIRRQNSSHGYYSGVSPKLVTNGGSTGPALGIGETGSWNVVNTGPGNAIRDWKDLTLEFYSASQVDYAYWDSLTITITCEKQV